MSGSSCSRGSRISTATRRAAPRGAAAAAASRAGRGSRRRRRSPSAAVRGGRSGGRARRRATSAPIGSRSGSAAAASRSGEQAAISPAAAATATGLRSPKVAARRARLPRRAAKWPIASATPSATSHLRRSAVPNVIEADVSSTSHVSTARSATWTRTCGSPVRAVDVPVDAADVVAQRVRPDLRELGAVAERPRAVVAGEQARRCACARAARACAGEPPGVGPGPGRAGVRSSSGSVAGHATPCRRGRAAASRSSRARGRGSSRRRRPRRAPRSSAPSGGGARPSPARDVLRQHVAAAAQQRERAGAEDEVDRAARAGAVLDVRRRAPRARAASASASRVAISSA